MKYIFTILMLCAAITSHAQDKLKIKVSDAKTHEPLELVTISSNNNWLGSTDDDGVATVTLPAEPNKLHISLTGYEGVDTTVQANGTGELSIFLESTDNDLEEVTVLASTRNNESIENSPSKVEVLGLEEMNEEAAVKPGNIGSILGDVSGVQVQQSSATSGNSNVRIQGLGGKYTQILRDGMPLYDGFSGGFGIMTIPPLDLKQIELIKGSASTLYGGGAIGGLINLISKRPAYKQELDALVNYTSLKEGNVNVYAARRNDKIGYNIFAGYTNQQALDVNKDGLSDVPKFNTFLVHPRIFFYPSTHTIISVGYNGSFDDRKGGDMQVLQNKQDNIHQYFETNQTQRHTEEYFVEQYFDSVKLTVKGNLSNFNRDVQTNTYSVNGRQLSFYNEASVFVPVRKNDFVGGVNVTGDNYKTSFPDTAHLQSFNNTTVGAFGQFDAHIKKTTIETGIRFDVHNRYGLFVLPRIALFHRFSEVWAVRGGFGMGYKTPNPLVPQNIDYSVLQLEPIPAGIKPEISYGYNAEVNFKKKWGETSLFINQAFFLTDIYQPILFNQATDGMVTLANATGPIVSRGFDTYAKLDIDEWELYFGYTFTDARYTYLPVNNFIPLTPKNRGACIVAKQFSKKFRAGIEGSYVGAQYRYDATMTPGYFFMAAMLQYNIGEHISIVLNAENLLDYRMSRVESLYTGSISNPQFKPLWAPIDGRVINLSLRWKL